MKRENVLIVEGEESSKTLLSRLMERQGYDFIVEADPSEALNRLKNERFTIVIAEVSLLQPRDIPEIQEENPDMFFIFTGSSLEKSNGLVKPNLSDFLSKPFGSEEAEFRLKRVILERDTRLRNRKVQKALETTKDELERRTKELESSVEDLENIKHLYREIGGELTATTEKLREANHQLEVLAKTDGLTEVYNHRYFMDKIGEIFEDWKKKAVPLSLLMIDIDYFKAFNDNHGHMTGDLVLKDIAGLLKSNCREHDIVARYGGEEFAIILPETGSDKAEAIAEKIRKCVENHRLSNGDGSQRVTVSIGIGTSSKDTGSFNALISLADKALYHAKARGRNQVALGEPNAPMPVLQWFSRF
ncbi:MAG: diguanylate cyclase [Proteobacteria bacterium]|nr:diguanylate cyclase [Pseudomonadota bacterium]NIS70214.1 diguanylate cyclase [Pseudomonadota bacterium]